MIFVLAIFPPRVEEVAKLVLRGEEGGVCVNQRFPVQFRKQVVL